MHSLDVLALFVSIADHGGFSAAARALGLPKSTVSRQLSDYEAHLGLTLFHRSTRAISLTEDGARLYKMAKPAIQAALEIDQVISDANSGPSGCVTITTTAAIGQYFVAPHLASLIASHPNIQVELRLTEQRVNIISDAVDIAIRMGSLEDSSLIAKRLTSIERLIVASPRYLENKGQPAKPSELSQHDCIIIRRDLSMWHFRNGEDIRLQWKIAAGNMLVARDLAISGQGLAMLPTLLVKDDIDSNRLVPVLSHFPISEAPAWIVTTQQKHRSYAVRVVMEHLISALCSYK